MYTEMVELSSQKYSGLLLKKGLQTQTLRPYMQYFLKWICRALRELLNAQLQRLPEIYWRLLMKTFALGEEYSNAKLVSKLMRFLLKRFSIKVTVIEEAKDIESLEIDELNGFLQTFEMNFKDVKHNKTKGDRNIAFQVGEGVPTSQNTIIEKFTVDDCDSDSDSKFGSDEEFLKTYKEILGKLR
ncbi:hypothetical protein CXB51_014677 [Gossypium anomalum]|uniref:Uncharacterized protein n=1 Tax=Gossypium anomalum TaxID=47600 RepID=A0A8J5YRU4_9ROSI|nr:hypothetical protein CXB51_014677 [Gossypium anomalum]